jgi:multicomponent Na+:H+ antiporter subunit G
VSVLAADLLIYLLLLAGVGFGGISLMGLLIFPDLHSRMYTALRAGLISMAAIIGAGVVYALTLLAGTGSDQYSAFLFHTMFLAAVVAVSIMVIDRQVLEKTKALIFCGNPAAQDAGNKKGES